MTSVQFAYWLQGFFEISGKNARSLNEEQTKMIKNHLNLVFFHEIDDSYSKDPIKLKKMDEIHQTGTHVGLDPEDFDSYSNPPFHDGGGSPLIRC